MCSIINLNVFNDLKKAVSTRWRITENNQLLKDLKNYGLENRLKINTTSAANFKFFEIKDGTRSEMVSGEDDLSMLGCDYDIIDERLVKAEEVSTTSFISSTPPRHTSTVVSVSFNDDQTAATSFASSPDGFSTPPRPAKMRRMASGPAAKTPTRTEHIGFFFHRHRADVFKKYDEYRSGTALTFKNINIYDFFNERELGKAAVYLLRENVEPELQKAAFYVILNVTMDLIEIITPRFDLPRPDRQPLCALLNALTSTKLFSHITASNGLGTLDDRIKNKKKSKSRKAPQIQLQNQSLSIEAEIKALSSTMNGEVDDRKITKLFENSGDLLYKWIQILSKAKENERGMVSQFLAKFPQIKANVCLIHHAYQRFTCTRRSTISDLASKFRDLVPAIIEMSSYFSSHSDVETLSKRQQEFLAGGLLADLIKQKAYGNANDYSRFVIDCTDSAEVHNALQKKSASGITAPSILALGTYPEVTFWIAVDNVPLKVPGSFADALQSFMEVTWLFNLKYDVKTQAFVRFFEILMGYSKSVSTSRMQLLQQLMDLKIIISRRNSEPSSTTSPTHQSPNVPCSNDLANNSNSDLQL